MYIELKHPAHYNLLAKRNNYTQTVEEILVQALEDNNIQVDDVLLQSFDPASLLKLFRISEFKLVYLIWEESKLDKLECFSQMFYGIGVWKNLLFTNYNETQIGEPSGLVDLLHSYGYQVHVYTIRNDNLHIQYNQDLYEELDALYNQNIDGFFTDYPESLTKFLDCKYD